MKKIILIELLRRLKEKPNLLRKVKVFALIGVVGIFITAVLAVWAGVSAVSYFASSAIHAVQSPVTQAQVKSFKEELSALPKLQAHNCWDKAQSLMTVQPWVERPLMENLTNLKEACLDSKSAVCQGTECETIKKIINTTEGRTI